MKRLLILAAIAAFFMSGCASLQNAGTASYSIKQVTDAKGQPGFDLEVRNGKEIANVEAHLTKDGDKVTVDLKEQGVAAFQGQQIAATSVQASIDAAAKAAVAAALAPLLPALAPAAGAALASPGIGAAAVGAGAVILKDKVAP